ncbi:MAG: ATP-grasp domain-containing protein [Vampirovibrio sp.]|nr:ATP-grasp domain-containing protein [Vampirovibrio sp.]
MLISRLQTTYYQSDKSGLTKAHSKFKSLISSVTQSRFGKAHPPLSIGILVQGQHDSTWQSDTIRRLRSAAIRAGHKVQIIKSDKCQALYSTTSQPKLYYDENLLKLDAVIPLFVNFAEYPSNNHAANILKAMENTGVVSLNTSNNYLTCLDKFQTTMVLHQNKVPFISSGLANTPEGVRQITARMRLKDTVIKILSSGQGKGVFRGQAIEKTNAILHQISTRFQSLISPLIQSNPLEKGVLIQPTVTESLGTDYRYNVLDGKVVGAYVRSAVKKEEFRASISLGGSLKRIYNYPKGHQKIAENAAKACRMGFVGVDIIETENGPAILELNPAGAVNAVFESDKPTLSDRIIQYLEQKVVHQAKARMKNTTHQ